MKRGPRKKLTMLDRLDGRPSHKAIRDVIEDSGIEALGSPFVPEHLMDDARGCMECIIQSMPDKVYSALDSYLLSAFGTAWAIHKAASLEVSSPQFEYIVTIGQNGALAQNPWLAILNKQAILIATLGDRLGLDPKSRASLKLPGARQHRSKFDGLVGQTESSASLSS